MHKATSIFVLGLVVLIAFFAVFGSHGLLRLIKVNHELQTLEQQNNVLQSEITQLRNTIFALDKSDAALEKTAREDLGLSKPDEIVYIFSRSEKTRSTK